MYYLITSALMVVILVIFFVVKKYTYNKKISNFVPRKDITIEQAKEEIINYFHHNKESNALEILLKLKIPLEVFDEACKQLLEEGVLFRDGKR